jgi:hypothetical protein
MIELLQESASFNRAFSSVEPTYCRGMVVDVRKGKHL